MPSSRRSRSRCEADALLKELRRVGCELHRHGKKHDLYINPANGKKAPVPRHTEMKNSLAELIRKQLGLA